MQCVHSDELNRGAKSIQEGMHNMMNCNKSAAVSLFDTKLTSSSKLTTKQKLDPQIKSKFQICFMDISHN
jgi:hypothetical protein